MNTTDKLLLKRALSLLTRMPDLHEVSYRMGKAGDGASPETMRREFMTGQMLINESAQLATELYAAISEKP